MSFIKKFNEHLDRFLSGLIEMFPDMKKFVTYRATINLIKKANVRQPVDAFIEHILPHKQYIIKEDHEFFLNLKYDESVGGNQDTNAEAIQFKEIWKSNMSAESRKNVFKHLKLLCMLSEKC